MSMEALLQQDPKERHVTAAQRKASFQRVKCATRIQSILRMWVARREARERKGERADMLEALKEGKSSMAIGGKRVTPWSDESAELAMAELGGRVGERGMVLWPKGTVEKLLVERTKYSDIVNKYKRAEKRRQAAAQRAEDMARRTVTKVMKQTAKSDNDPTWQVKDWLNSIGGDEESDGGLPSLASVLAEALLGQLRARSTDTRFELGFMSYIGSLPEEEGKKIVRGMLDGTDYLEKVSGHIATAARRLNREMAKQKASQGNLAAGGGGSKFVEGGAAGFTLTFGDRRDFFQGLEKLIGKPDPVSFRSGMRRDHTAGPDATRPFTAHNYGTTTTSEAEWYFVVDPTQANLEKLELSEWPVDTKLRSDPKTQHKCRQPRPLSEFAANVREVTARLEAMGIAEPLDTDKLIGARLYTGPTFGKTSTQ